MAAGNITPNDREYFETLVKHERELREAAVQGIVHERELRAIAVANERELRLVAESAVEKARSIQFDEYERRLDQLNHAHEEAKETARKTVPRETFENYIKESAARLELALANAEERRQELLRQIGIEREARLRMEGSLDTWRKIAAFLGLPGIIALLIGLYNAFAR